MILLGGIHALKLHLILLILIAGCSGKKDVLTYKDFFGSVHFDSDDQVFHGKIQGIEDLVTFEGTSVSELVQSFEEAVEDYLDLCNQTGKKPEKGKGEKGRERDEVDLFISKDLHRYLCIISRVIS